MYVCMYVECYVKEKSKKNTELDNTLPFIIFIPCIYENFQWYPIKYLSVCDNL